MLINYELTKCHLILILKCNIFEWCQFNWNSCVWLIKTSRGHNQEYLLTMEIMKSCHKFMLILGICAPIDNNKWKIFGGILRSITVLTAITVSVFQPCTRYFLQHLSNLVDATGVALMISIGFCAAVGIISFSLQQKHILHTLLHFQLMVKKCMNLIWLQIKVLC